MVDNFMSAGTNGGADDDEMPAPYGTGPRNQPPSTTPPPTPAPAQQPAPEQPRPIWYQPDAEQPPVTPAPPVHPLTRRRNQLAAPQAAPQAEPQPAGQPQPPAPQQASQAASQSSQPAPPGPSVARRAAARPTDAASVTEPRPDQAGSPDPVIDVGPEVRLRDAASAREPATESAQQPAGSDALDAPQTDASTTPLSDALAASHSDALGRSQPDASGEPQPDALGRSQPDALDGPQTVDVAANAAAAAPASTAPPATADTATAPRKRRRIRIHHLKEMKDRGEKWSMLTAYDQYAAEIFDEAGIQVLLVGDSAANNVYGYESTLRITVDELLALARGVVRAVQHTLVVADLPFGSYQGSPEQAFETAVRFMKEAGVHAVKLEGGRTVVPQVSRIVQAGVPVMGHLGFTPQSEHGLGGYRVQGRGDSAAALIDDAIALAEAGVFAVVLEMVPGDVAAEITKRIPVPTIGIGAGRDCDAQVLVWQDMAGLRSGPMPRFVKKYADLRGVLLQAATDYAADVATGTFPSDDHTF
jgi:3-methyl-2-oxobutanoate hydroxymethyltransferase